jgi:hypothetical protein
MTSLTWSESVESMGLICKPDFGEARARWQALYEGEIIDRPVTAIEVPMNPANPAQSPQYLSFLAEGIDGALDQFEAYAKQTWYLGDAMPSYRPEAGADMFAGFLGTPLRYDWDRYPGGRPDAWSIPTVTSWEEALPLRLSEENELWQTVQRAVRRTAERGHGKYLVTSLDLHSNIDALTAMRGPGKLIYDMFDTPELVHRAMYDARAAYRQVSERIYALSNTDTWGSVRGPYSPGRYNTIASDIAAVLSPELFREFVMPAIEDEADYLDHAMFHIDGPDMLKFLDDILAVDGIQVINWVPGVQNQGKRFAEWTDVFRRVQDAGKIMQIYDVTAEEVKVLAKELHPARVYYSVKGVQTHQEADELLGWLTRHT